MKKILLSVASLVIAGSILLQLAPRPSNSKPTKPPHLEELLVKSFPGWEIQPMELGETEAVREATDKTLRFDDYVFLGYKSQDAEFEIYAAYWGPGKMPVQLVASHTPDRCWVENGWSCTQHEFGKEIHKKNYHLLPAQSRTFSLHNQTRHVLYWHLLDGKPNNLGERITTTPSPTKWLKGFWKHLWVDHAEQYFIRITSPDPIDQLWHEPVFLETIERLGTIGLTL